MDERFDTDNEEMNNQDFDNQNDDSLEQDAPYEEVNNNSEINNINRYRARNNSNIAKVVNGEIAIPVAIKTKLILALIPVVLVIVITYIFMNGADLIQNENSSSKLASAGYYDIGCEEVNVRFADKKANYAIYDTGTYEFEEYIAGVVTAEVGQFNNLEVFKEFAIAARTYFAANHNNCTI